MRVIVLVVLLLSMSCHKPTEPPPADSPDSTSHSILWQTDSMGYYSSRLLHVWGTSATSVFAVGVIQTEGSEPTKNIMHYNGSSWTPVFDDSLRWWIAAGLLTGIHGLSDTAVFVAGSGYNAGRTTSFVARWNGQRLRNISPIDTAALLTIWVKSETEVYAAGNRGAILRYDGNSWIRLDSGTDLDVWQITGSSAGEIYAICSDYFNSFAGSLILRIEGSSVVHEQFSSVGQKFGIWATLDGTAYAVGEGTFRKTRSSQWGEISTPNPRVALWSVHGTAPNNIVVAGAYGAVIHWSGRTWKFYDGLYDRSSAKSYFKAFAVGNKYFLVGNTPSHALITIGTRSYP